MSFYVGQKVVFVGFPPKGLRDRFDEFLHPIPGPWPEMNAVYTVVRLYSHEDGIFLSLFELREETDHYWSEGWSSDGFRPVVERKTDISVLTEMLLPQRELALTSTHATKA